MAETAIAAVLCKLGELAASEAKILLEVGDNLTLLRDRLEWLQAFIRDADRKRRGGTDQLTSVWVRQTRNVAFEAEDTLDEFIHQVDLKSQSYRRWKKMWRKYLTGLCTQIVNQHALAARIKSINTRLAKISENQKEYNIGHTPLAPVTSSTTATSAWFDNAVGFEGDVATLKQLLLRNDHMRQIMFLSILGESGIGKQTLVRMLYNNLVAVETTTCVFKVVIWVNLPADSTVDFLLQEIYNKAVDWCKREKIAYPHQPIKKVDGGIVNDDDITNKLRQLLAEKRYLVIIGGISSKTMLNCVRASLPDVNNGSRVLLKLDIENEEVAWHANTMNQEKGFNGIHMLHRLDEKRSWQLFRFRAFRREVVSSDGSKEDVMMTNNDTLYDKIVYDITGGYPLAIVVLAGLLRFKERPGQWEAVLQQLRPAGAGPRSMAEALAIVQGGGSGSREGNQQLITEANNKLVVVPSSSTAAIRTTTIERVFWESFEDLPNDLKSCFLYFACAPKDTFAHPSTLVKMWIAEGFIKPQKGNTLEELGHSYLKELVLRCLVQVQKTNITGSGGIDERVFVHRRLHGFLQSEAREAGFMEVLDMHHAFVPPSVRRLSFVSLGGRYIPFTNEFPKLRSFLCWVEEEQHHRRHHQSSNDVIVQDTSKKQQYGHGYGYGHDLRFLCGSKFLRVIKVRRLRIVQLPDNIGDLINLRYLGVNCKDLEELPSSIKRLLNLQTLDIRGTQVDKIDPGFWKIRTLRHVLADKLTLPESIEEELDELQTLSGVKPAAAVVATAPAQECPLHKMSHLRSLNLHGITHEMHWAALETALADMHLLGDLSLQGDVIPSCVFTSSSLRFLETVELDGTVKEWPGVGWDASRMRPNLVQVILRNSNEVPKHIQEEIDKIHKRKVSLRYEISTSLYLKK